MANADVIGTGSFDESGPRTDVTAEAEPTVRRWIAELDNADKFVRPWHDEGKRAIEAFLDTPVEGTTFTARYRLNLFHANIVTLRAMLYAKLPKVEADRRFFDPNDDVARVAAEMITRILQNDLNDPEDKFDTVIKAVLNDRLLAGLGCARVRYVMTEGDPDPQTGVPVKSDERCEVVYVHWQDVRWSPARIPAEIRWKAYRSFLSKDEVRERFGDDIAERVPYQNMSSSDTRTYRGDGDTSIPECEIWEIWDRDTKTVYWVTRGFDWFLDVKPDPLGLRGFFPDPPWLMANCTTQKYLPKPDYQIARDLYEEIDRLESRLVLLTDAAKAVGVYDASDSNIQRLMTEGVENTLIPVKNWARFAENGGFKGCVDWLPIEQVVNAIQVLGQQQALRINQLYQVTGMSDIIRGQATQTNVTATEQRIKAQFGSARIQALQDEFTAFVGNLLSLKVQLIQRYYDPQRIVELSNILSTPDAPLAQAAVALIKDFDKFNVRVVVQPESMALQDRELVKTERVELLQGIAQFIGMSATLLEQMPESAPFLLQLLQFGVAGFRGASEMEGVIDQAIASVQKSLAQRAANPQPSPEQVKAQSEQMRAMVEIQKMHQEIALAQQDIAREREEAQRERERFLLELRTEQEKHELKMQEMFAKLYAQVLTIREKAKASRSAESRDRRANGAARSGNAGE
ncbi:MAG: hypothetical protein NZ534_00085 [Bacteroidia bacterium]|nr:hypothetical protein [Bacteroidia bacterium]